MNTAVITSLARAAAHLQKQAGLVDKGVGAAGKLLGTAEKTMPSIAKPAAKTMMSNTQRGADMLLGAEHDLQLPVPRRLGPAAQLANQSNRRALSAANPSAELGRLGQGVGAEGKLLNTAAGSGEGMSGSAKALLGTAGAGALGLGSMAAYGASRPPVSSTPEAQKSQLGHAAFGGSPEGAHGGMFGKFRDMYDEGIIQAHRGIGQRRMSELQQTRDRLREMEDRFRSQGFGSPIQPGQMHGMNPYMAYNG